MWFGVSIEDGTTTSRIRIFAKRPLASGSFRSSRLSPLSASSTSPNIDWVIVGGESGPGARPMEKEWVIDIRNQCVSARVRSSSSNGVAAAPKTGGRLLEGKEWSQFPATQIGCPKAA